MVGWQCDRERFGSQLENPQAPPGGASAATCTMPRSKSSLPQFIHLGCADLLANVEVDPRVPRANAANQLRQQIEHRASDDAQANRTLFTARNAADEVGGVRGLLSTARARGTSAAPAGVSVTRRLVRSNSRAPSWDSKRERAWVSAGCDR